MNFSHENWDPFWGKISATHVIFQPLDFIGRLAALVPKPRVNLTRFHGVFAPEQPTPRPDDAGQAGQGQQSQGSR